MNLMTDITSDSYYSDLKDAIMEYADKRQWHSTETIWLEGYPGMFLKSHGSSGVIGFHVKGRDGYCPVFLLDVDGWHKNVQFGEDMLEDFLKGHK